MLTPWVSRKLLDAATDRAIRAEVDARQATERLAEYRVEANKLLQLAQNEIQSLRVDQKLLIDRVVQLSGQPAIYAPAPEPKPSAPSNIAAPEERVTFATVHKKAREAIATGKLNLGVNK